MSDPRAPEPSPAPVVNGASGSVRLAAPQAGGKTTAPAHPVPSRAVRAGRAFLSTVFIVLGVLSLALSPVAIWGRNLVLNTDKYVQTLAPLASNPGVQDVVVAQVDKQVDTHLDVAAYLHQVLPPRAAKLLAAPIQSAVFGLVHTVAIKVVQSKAFGRLWVTINRVAHQEVVAILTGKKIAGGILVIRSGKIYLDLSQVVRTVRGRLVSAGIAVASKVPVVGSTLEIAKVKGLESAQSAVRALNSLADWLPWIGVALITGGAAVARRHRRAVIAAALGLGAGMVFLGVALVFMRNAYVSAVPADISTPGTSAYVFDTLVRFLRWGIRLVLAVALLVALGAWVGGASASAVAVRRGVSNWAHRLGQGLPVGPLTLFVARYANVLRVVIVALGATVLLLINPSAGTVILLAIIVVMLLLAVELLRAPVVRTPAK